MNTNEYATRLTPSFWKKYFSVYDVLKELQPYCDLLDSIIKNSRIEANHVVLDLGAGTGNLEERLPTKPSTLYALDSSPEGLAICSEKNPWVDILCADITKPLPYEKEMFDVVVSNNTLYTLPRKIRPAVLEEIFRITKKNGVVVIANLVEEFSPLRIYLSGIRSDLKKYGLMKTIAQIVTVLPATIKMFYYNARISSENKNGYYDFFHIGEQAEELMGAGFVIEKEEMVYANQGELVVARKP